jgi:hypothetical protein|nr:MAG TPA: hypothetical protein [Caudoviricetes sp.]
MNTNELTDKQKSLRYSISIDFECMNEKGYTRESALDWFKTDECEEAYDGYIVNGIYEPTNENFSDVVKEVFFDCGYYKKW